MQWVTFPIVCSAFRPRAGDHLQLYERGGEQRVFHHQPGADPHGGQKAGACVLLLAVLIGLINVAISYQALIHERKRMALKGRIESFVVQMLMGITKLKASASEAMGFGRWSGLFRRTRVTP